MAWAGIVNRAFTAGTVGDYLRTLPRPGFVKFIVVHNTGAPSLKTYRGYADRANPISDAQWLRNLEGYYRDNQKWSAGPHWFVTPNANGILAFTPSTVRGTHSPSWNATSLGVEMVGDYQSEPFDPGVRRNVIGLLAELHIWLNISPDTIRFHREDVATTHKDCPGKNVVKADLVAAVKAKIAEIKDSAPVAMLDVPTDASDTVAPTVPETQVADAAPYSDTTDISASRRPPFFRRVSTWVKGAVGGIGLTSLGALTDWQVVAILCGFVFLVVACTVTFVIVFFGAEPVREWVRKQVN